MPEHKETGIQAVFSHGQTSLFDSLHETLNRS
jgi:hypothetical protein